QIPENDEDFVLLKSDGIPTYHFAHAVDDHLMGTTHVIRGEEWLPSLAKHIQLFQYLGFKMPKFMHLAQLMKLDGNSKKKLSKRDKGAALADYKAEGYPPESVIEYVMTLLNSNYEDWRRANQDADWKSFPFSIKKMNTSGALFDLDKFTDVSKTTISRMDAEKAYNGIADWAKEYDTEFSALLTRDPEYAKRILAIGRGGKKPRKDLAKWNEAKDYMSFFYDELFTVVDEYPEGFDTADIKAALEAFAASYDHNTDNNGFFENVKAVSEKLGFSPDVKAYKASPESFKGHVGDVSGFIRVAVTGRQNSPDLFEIMQILGYERTVARVKAAADKL
ncbi:MAG: glutamate--tRNA ligase, partial [Clostridia bacterium]|nr:glutamate--tRNA ligase [Clostridia bacterium]